MKWWQWFLAFTWELPQTLVALFLKLVLYCDETESVSGNRKCYVHYVSSLTCWSLGEFLFFRSKYRYFPDWETTVKHETGHSIQSRIFGWFYLILVALPSVIWNVLSRFIPWCYKHYYDTPWEGNYLLGADRLGGVER